MRFIIVRTSVYGDEESPCDGAKLETLTEVIGCTCKTLEDTKRLKWFWAEDKKNQRVTQNGTACDAIMNFWIIDIDNPLDLVEKYGDIILKKSDCLEVPYEIEIYDDYRE